MDEKALSIVIPVFNEAEAVSRLEGRLAAIRQKAAFPMEFVLVDDGSDDGSQDVLAGFRAPDVTVLRHDRNMGYGAALKTGIRAAKHPLVAITDADETYPDEHVAALADHVLSRGADMAVGARTGARVSIPLARRPAKWLLGALANILTGRRIPDLNSGLRVISRDLAMQYFRILPDGFSFTATITLALLSDGFRVDFLPINYRARSGRSKFRPIIDTLNYAQLICRAALWFRPMRVFFPLAAIVFLSAFGLLAASWALTGKPMDVSFGVLLMTSVILFVAGMLADLINRRAGK